MKTKIRRLFTIDKQVYEDFKIIGEKMSISKSKYIENRIKEFIKENKHYLKDEEN